MKLTDLNPRWLTMSQYTLPGGTLCFPRWSGEKRVGCGVTFDDPTNPQQRLGVFFENPIDGLPPADGQKLWHREGDSFDNLTLTPSIDASASGGWHGFITKGNIQ